MRARNGLRFEDEEKKKKTEEEGKSEIRARKTGSEVEEDVEKREERREHPRGRMMAGV